jgi:hypothetical protein
MCIWKAGRAKQRWNESWPLTEVQFTHPQPAPEHTLYSTTAIPGIYYDSLFVVVEYSGGITVEKEIPKF